MADNWKVMQLTAPGRAEIKEMEIPKPGTGEIRLRIEAVATCPHWDRKLFAGVPMFDGMALEYPWWPGQPGHEAIGRVESVGDGVAADWSGKRVAVWRSTGPYQTGMYGSHGITLADNVLEIPEDLPADQVTSLELAMCVQVSVDQLEEIGAVRGRRLAVAGMGPAGLVALQLLRRAGAGEIVAIDHQQQRLDLALQLGADSAVMPGDAFLPAGRNSEQAFHAAIDTTGQPVAIEDLLHRTRRAVALFGVIRQPVRFTPELWYGGLSLIGYGEHNKAAGRRALDAVLDGSLDLRPLFTHRMPLSDYAGAVALLDSMQAIKVLFAIP